MTKYSRIMALCLWLTPFCAHAAQPIAQSPLGEWRVEEGTAHIRMVDCDKKLWGIISWADKPGMDENNPDASRRNQPILGLPIILGMQLSADNLWEGKIYNSENGKIYQGSISLKSASILHIRGCLLGGLFCGGEDWSRISNDPGQQSDVALCQRLTDRTKM